MAGVKKRKPIDTALLVDGTAIARIVFPCSRILCHPCQSRLIVGRTGKRNRETFDRSISDLYRLYSLTYLSKCLLYVVPTEARLVTSVFGNNNMLRYRIYLVVI